MNILTRFTRRAVITGTALASLAGLAGAGLLTAPAAGAATLPVPAAQSFTIQFPPGAGFAFGPLSGPFFDNEISDTAGIWVFPGRLGGTVLVRHTAVSQPDINPFTCQGTLHETGRWTLFGLTRHLRNAFGFGRFRATVVVQLGRHRNGTCDENNVLFSSTRVTGTGLVSRR